MKGVARDATWILSSKRIHMLKVPGSLNLFKMQCTAHQRLSMYVHMDTVYAWQSNSSFVYKE